MEKSGGFLPFIREYGTLILAGYAVVQIWLIALWKHFIWTGKLSIFKTGRLEVGYSSYGPTVGLHGTLTAGRKNVFVRDISLTLTKDRDGSTHQFGWAAFRSPQIRLPQNDPVTLELPSGFNVRLDQPYRYNIVFSDGRTRTELEPALLAVYNTWRQYLIRSQGRIVETARNTGVTNDVVIDHLYTNDFCANSQEWTSAWDLLNRKNYWESGSYSLRMTVTSAAPAKTFSEEWSFTLGDQDFNTVRLNAVATLRELCLGKTNFFFAYPEYDKVPPHATA